MAVVRLELELLLNRAHDTSIDAASGQSRAWLAFREAEQLRDRAMVDELRAYAASQRRWQQRGFAYFVIGKIGLNLSDPTCATALIEVLRTENNKHVLSTVLNAIGEIPKPREVGLDPVYDCLEDPRWLVRQSAISALRNSESKEAEDRLIALLASSSEPNDLICCHATLNEIGTPRAILAISANLTSRKRDVRASAEMAIEAIQRRHGKAGVNQSRNG